jgi:NTE family protein
MKISVALGGGGTRCVAHIGALMALEEAGYEIEKISGSSGGALVAALYARGYTTKELRQMAYSLNWFSVPFLSKILAQWFEGHPVIKDHYCVVTDLHTKELVIKNPSVREIVSSCWIVGTPAIDGVFVDGCVANNVPINILPEPRVGFNVIAKIIDRRIKLNWLQQIARVIDLSCLQQLEGHVIDIMPKYVNPFKTSKRLYSKWIGQAYRITKEEIKKWNAPNATNALMSAEDVKITNPESLLGL